MNVFVTGGSGFLGGYVVRRLVASGHAVTGLSRRAEAAQRLGDLGATPVTGDLDDPASVDGAFATAGADALVNLASLGFGHAPAIIAAAEEAGVRRAVFVSTTAIFTRLNARSKSVRVAAEDAIRSSSLDWTILRPTMIYGAAGDRNMARLVQLVRRSPVVPLPGGGHGLQQPVHVEDLADAIVAALTAPAAVGQAYDLAGPEPLTLRDVVRQAGVVLGRTPRVVPAPLGAAVYAARLYEKANARPRLKAEQFERLAEDKVFDIAAARRDLGFDPRPFAVGIAEEAAFLV